MTSRSEPVLGGASRTRPGGPAAARGLRIGGPADGGDAAAFLDRLIALDPGALVRLRDVGGRVTGYARLPFSVLVSRTVAGSVRPDDVTVAAADLLRVLEPTQGRGGEVALPASRDVEWRAALPPRSGWQRLDEVPAEVVRSLVRAGAETLRAVPAGAAASAGESLLDHEALTVSGAGRTVPLPLRVLTALARMGFLGAVTGAGGGRAAVAGAAGAAGGAAGAGIGGDTGGGVGVGGGGTGGGAGEGADLVLVSAAGGWIRLAAAYGSAYHSQRSSLGLSLR